METSKFKTTYFVTSCDQTGKELNQRKFDKFNKEEITEEIKTQLTTINDGCEVEYWTCNKTFAYIHLQTYVKRNGKILLEVIKGSKVFYKKSNIFS